MKTILTFNFLRAERDASKDIRDGRIDFPMDLFIREVKRMGGTRAIVSFVLNSSTNPEVASFQVSGEVCVEGTVDEVSSVVSPAGEEPPEIWKGIYHESVNTMMMLAKAIEVPFPARAQETLGD